MNKIDFTHQIIPQTEIEIKIMADPCFIEGINYGIPRSGHPEGKVLFHVLEVLGNVKKYGAEADIADLRLVALVHDTFKYKVDESKPKCGENHHGMMARRFLERYMGTARVLDVTELHDEAYNSWRMLNRGDQTRAELRAIRLMERLGKNLDFFLTFYRCDNETGDKSRENFIWFSEFSRRSQG